MKGQSVAQRHIDYLMVAGLPTPNGPLHLGHIGGPYLRADILARNLRRGGTEARVVTGIDYWNSYTLYTAEQEKLSPESLAARNVAQITSGLAGFAVCDRPPVDVSPNGEMDAYAHYSDEFTRHLGEHGLLRVEAEELLYSPRAGRHIAGAWLTGTCPHCGSGAAGTSCEECGGWFMADEMAGARSRIDFGALIRTRVPRVVAVTSSAFDSSALTDRFPPSAASLLASYHAMTRGRIRLTEPFDWGIPWPLPVQGKRLVHNIYGSGMYALTRTVEDKATGIPAARSTKRIVFGGLEYVVPALHLWELRHHGLDTLAFDFHVLNGFLTLNGQKFSTSRRHVIWAHEWLERGLSPDAARLYLATVCPEDASGDFESAAFTAFTARWLRGLDRAVAEAATALCESGAAPPSGSDAMNNHVAAVAEAQDKAMRLPSPSVREYAAAFLGWLDSRGEAASDPARWLLATAWLGWPLMPAWANRVFAALGYPPGDPPPPPAAGLALHWSGGLVPALGDISASSVAAVTHIDGA